MATSWLHWPSKTPVENHAKWSPLSLWFLGKENPRVNIPPVLWVISWETLLWFWPMGVVICQAQPLGISDGDEGRVLKTPAFRSWQTEFLPTEPSNSTNLCHWSSAEPVSRTVCLTRNSWGIGQPPSDPKRVSLVLEHGLSMPRQKS